MIPSKETPAANSGDAHSIECRMRLGQMRNHDMHSCKLCLDICTAGIRRSADGVVGCLRGCEHHKNSCNTAACGGCL